MPVTDKMEATARGQRMMARSAAAAADVVEFMPPLTDQRNARVARSLSSSPARAALTAPVKVGLQETFHTSVPTAGDFAVGQRVVGTLGVHVAEGGTKGRECKGTVMYIGELSFKHSGEVWIGVCFDEAVGKNDGSVQGKTYFKCPAMRGRFVKPKHLRLSKETSVDPLRWSSHIDPGPGVVTVAGAHEAQGVLHAAEQEALPAARLAAAIFENMESLGQNVATTAAAVNTVDVPGSVRMLQLSNVSSMGEESFSVEEQKEIDIALKQYNSTVTVLSEMLLVAMTALERREDMGDAAKQRVRNAVGKDLSGRFRSLLSGSNVDDAVWAPVADAGVQCLLAVGQQYGGEGFVAPLAQDLAAAGQQLHEIVEKF